MSDQPRRDDLNASDRSTATHAIRRAPRPVRVEAPSRNHGREGNGVATDAGAAFLLPLSDEQLRMAALEGHPLLWILLGLSADKELIRRDRPSSRDVSSSLLNGLGVLAAICEHPESSQADIGEKIGVSKSTAGRYLKTWEKVGVLERNPSTHGYRLAACWQIESP